MLHIEASPYGSYFLFQNTHTQNNYNSCFALNFNEKKKLNLDFIGHNRYNSIRIYLRINNFFLKKYIELSAKSPILANDL